jgi:hypothetical protein
VLLLKLLNFVLAGLWLTVNHADAQGHDYPLIRPKYALLLGLTPLVVTEGVLQVLYFADLKPEVITSCCGSLFARSGAGLAGDLASLPAGQTGAAFFGTLVSAIAAAVVFLTRGRGGHALAALAALAIPVSLASVVAFLSPYVYELPTHRCPFCLLQREYHFVGYPLYAALLGGAIAGMGVGVLAPARAVPSLVTALPAFQRKLAMTSALLFAALVAIAAWEIATSQLRM